LRGNQKPEIEERQTIQWSSEERQTIQWSSEERQTIQWSSEERQTIQWSSEKGQNDKMHRKLKIEQHGPHKNVGEFRCSKLDIYVFLKTCCFNSTNVYMNFRLYILSSTDNLLPPRL
jgi:hypothetical protein